VYGIASGAATTNYGVYGEATGGTTNYAGYFGVGIFQVDGAATFASTANVNGNATLGDASSDNHDINGTLTVEELRYTPIAPTSVSGTQHDWAPSGVGDATFIHVTPSGAIDLTGITGGTTGRVITVRNEGSIGYEINLYHENAGSTAANRFDLPGDTGWTLRAGDAISFTHDGSRWVGTGHLGRKYPGLWSTGDVNLSSAGSIVSAVNGSFSGTMTIDGNTTLGNADTDIVSFTGYPSFDVNMKGIKDATPAPSLSVCGTGASATTGGNFAFTVTTGTGTVSPCVVTFPDAFASTPTCVVQARGATKTFTYTVSTSAVTISSGATSTAYDVICVGH
jgi:hypothetical protein